MDGRGAPPSGLLRSRSRSPTTTTSLLSLIAPVARSFSRRRAASLAAASLLLLILSLAARGGQRCPPAGAPSSSSSSSSLLSATQPQHQPTPIAASWSPAQAALSPPLAGAAPPASALAYAGPAPSPYAPVVAPGTFLLEAPPAFVDAFERDAYSAPGDPPGRPGGRRRWRRRWHQLAGAATKASVSPFTGGGNDGGSCVSHARGVAEPMSALYEPRYLDAEEEGQVGQADGGGSSISSSSIGSGSSSSSSGDGDAQNKGKGKTKAPPPLELAGGVPRVAWRWDDDAEKEVRSRLRWTKRRFDALPFDLMAALEPKSVGIAAFRAGAAASSGAAAASSSPSSSSSSSPEDDHPCPHCSVVLRYKSYAGRLYVESSRRRRKDLGAGGDSAAEAFEGALLAGMHLFRVPDCDFALHLGDGAPGGDLAGLFLQQNVDRGLARAGIAAPFYAWRDALGPDAQMPALAACLDARFPRDFGASAGAAAAAAGAGGGLYAGQAAAAASAAAGERLRRQQEEEAAASSGDGAAGGGRRGWSGGGRRGGGGGGGGSARIPRAFWRGSSTDPRIAAVDEANLLDVARSRLALAGRWFPGLVDAAFTAHPQQAFSIASTEHGGGNAAEILLPLGKKVAPADQANAWALVLDADGNGWSDRFRHLSLSATPVLKQASNRTAFFEHVVAAPVFAPSSFSPASSAAAAAPPTGGGEEDAEEGQQVAAALLAPPVTASSSSEFASFAGAEDEEEEEQGKQRGAAAAAAATARRPRGGGGGGGGGGNDGLLDTFAPDAFDLPVRVRDTLAALGTEAGSAVLRRRVARRRAVTAAMLSQPAVAEAAAAAVAIAARLSPWEVEPPLLIGGGGAEAAEAGQGSGGGGGGGAWGKGGGSSGSSSAIVYEEVPRSRCCTNSVPREFAAAVQDD